MNIIPFFERSTEHLKDGEVYTLHKYCLKKFCQKCRNFYRNINEPGFYICPFGYTAYASNYGLLNNIIYTSLSVSGFYEKKKLKEREEVKNNFSVDEMTRLMGLHEMLLRKTKISETNAEEETKIIRGILHEVRRLSRDINAQGSAILSKIGSNSGLITALTDNIFATLRLISIRIDSYELYKNPAAITSATQPRIGVYKKFDKARHILNSQLVTRNLKMNFHNESYFVIDGYEIFDLLPYILLDNAVKYSVAGQEIDVRFYDSEKRVIIENIGPQVPTTQLVEIFERGVRGKNVKAHDGSGLGLFMAKQIAELHKIKYSAESNSKISFNLNGIPYSTFKITLDFKGRV